jgi:hypothetical protein
MTSFHLPLIEWGQIIPSKTKENLLITCFCLDDSDNELVVGFNNGSLYKISCDKGIIFISGSFSLRFPIDYIFRVNSDPKSEDSFENTNSVYFAINRAGNVMLFDAADGRCLLYNELHFDLIFTVQIYKDLAWILQDDGHLSIIFIPTVKLLVSSQLDLIGGQILACKLFKNELIVLFKEQNNSIIKSTCGYDPESSIVNITHENLEEISKEDILGALFERGDEIAITFWNERKLLFKENWTEMNQEDSIYLGQGVIAKAIDGDFYKLNRDEFIFPKRSGIFSVNNNWILYREGSTLKGKNIVSFREREFQIEVPRKHSIVSCKTLLDLHTFTVYKGYSDGSLRRFIYSDLFKEEGGVQFETAKQKAIESPINYIYNSRVTGKIWTGHENGELAQWDPITRSLVSVVKTNHAYAIEQIIESPEEWGGSKCALSIDKEGSLCLCTNDSHPVFVSDLPLEYGRLKCISWMSSGQIIPIEQNLTGKIWQIEQQNSECECNLIGSISGQQQPQMSPQNDFEEYIKTARHIDYPTSIHKKKHHLSHGLPSILHVVDDQDWIVPSGQLYMLDMRKILENEMSSEIGKEEEQKMTKSIIENCFGSDSFGIGVLG